MDASKNELRFRSEERDALRHVGDQITKNIDHLESSTADVRVLRSALEEQWRAAHERDPSNGFVLLHWADALMSLETDTALRTAASLYESADC